MGTHWEPGKILKSHFSPAPKKNLKGKKQSTLSACLGLTIGCFSNFSSQTSWTPFLAWAATPHKEHPNLVLFNPSSHQVAHAFGRRQS